MKTIDVHDLPERMVKAIAETVERLRSAIKKRANGTKQLEQVVWPLGVKGTLTREEIYGYLDE